MFTTYNERDDIYRPTCRQQNILLILCLSLPSIYTYNYDILSALQRVLQQQPYNLTIHQFNLAYTLTNSPAIVTCIIGGIIIDKWGISKCIFIFMTGMLIATGITYYSFYLGQQNSKSWYFWLTISRLILGIFGQNSFALQAVILSTHVDIINLTIFLGLGINVPWMLQSLNNVLTPYIYLETQKATWPAGVGVSIGMFCWLTSMYLIYYQKKLTQKKQQFILNENILVVQKFQCSNLKKLSLIYYFLVLLTIFLQGSFSTFLDNGNDLLVQRAGFQYKQAGILMSIPLTVSCLTTPLWGIANQKIPQKRRLYFMITLCLGLSLSLQLDIIDGGKLNWPLQILSLIAMGSGISGVYTILTGSIPLIVQQSYLGTAFGLLGSAQSFAMSSPVLIAAFLVSKGATRRIGYTYCLIMYLSFALVSLIIQVFIICSRHSHARLLDGDQQQQQTWQNTQLLQR